MNIIVCDICHRCIEGNDPSKDALMRPEDLYGSRIYVANPTIVSEDNVTKHGTAITLCNTCNETLYYYIANREALADAVQRQTLGNRIRFLLKLPLKTKEVEQG